MANSLARAARTERIQDTRGGDRCRDIKDQSKFIIARASGCLAVSSQLFQSLSESMNTLKALEFGNLPLSGKIHRPRLWDNLSEKFKQEKDCLNECRARLCSLMSID